MLGKGTSHGTGLLGPQIKRFELLAFVELAKVLTLRMADDSQHSSNGFSNKFSVQKKNAISYTSFLREPKAFQLCFTCAPS